MNKSFCNTWISEDCLFPEARLKKEQKKWQRVEIATWLLMGVQTGVWADPGIAGLNGPGFGAPADFTQKGGGRGLRPEQLPW